VLEQTIKIRAAQPSDRDAISAVIADAVHDANAARFPLEVIVAFIARTYSSEHVATKLREREVFVAVLDGRMIATAGLKEDAIRSVFVAPEYQGRGIGRALMHHIEALARERHLSRLTIPASAAGRPFYSLLGYRELSSEKAGIEAVTIMEKLL
jgi:GNAT superfamily N-acetyltransferase